MRIHVLSKDDISKLLPMPECIDLMERTMSTVSKGNAVLPLRTIMRMPGDIGMLGFMQGYLGEPEAFGVKLVSLFPRNHGTKYSSHLGVVMLFETEHGCPVALMDAAEITAIRTAAASGMATRLLAREDASTLSILGAGEQATKHLEAMLAVRDIRSVRVWARNPDKAKLFAQKAEERHGVTMDACPTVTEAVDGADIICTVSHASDPILLGDWVADGTHLNVVGSSLATAAEIDTDLVVKSRFFVDYKSSTIKEGGEYLRALHSGRIQESHILGEIGQVVEGSCKGRVSLDDITVYKSLGIAAQDIAAAHYALEKAIAGGFGQTVSL